MGDARHRVLRSVLRPSGEDYYGHETVADFVRRSGDEHSPDEDKADADFEERSSAEDFYGRERIANPDRRQGFARFIREMVNPDGTVDIFVEPDSDTSVDELRGRGVVTYLDATERSRVLNDYLWLMVRPDRLESIRNSAQDASNLEERGVRRIWPNVPLVPQAAPTVNQVDLSKVLTAIDMPDSATIPRPGIGITWAIIDTDIRDQHDMFSHGRHRTTITRKRVALDPGLAPPDFDVMIADPFKVSPRISGHGTHVGSIFNAIAPYSNIVSIALEGQYTSGKVKMWKIDSGHVQVALKWIQTQPDISGVNISLSVDPLYLDSLAGQSPVCKAVDDTVKAGKVVVTAAGNYGMQNNRYYELSITDPANAFQALVVGACDSTSPEQLGVCAFSSRGPSADGREKPDLVAPGLDIKAAWYTSNHDTKEESGTSQAAAVVSGACAVLVSSFNTGKRSLPGDIIGLLTTSAVSLRRSRTSEGAGILNLANALKAAHSEGYIQ